MTAMSEVSALKSGLLADIDAADTLDALEGLRVGALGKQGVVTGLLKTLGGMSPEERLEKGPPIQDLRESVTAAIAGRKAALEIGRAHV
jgi:phenylalanyl-tRNA synthetase alpha chain